MFRGHDCEQMCQVHTMAISNVLQNVPMLAQRVKGFRAQMETIMTLSIFWIFKNSGLFFGSLCSKLSLCVKKHVQRQRSRWWSVVSMPMQMSSPQEGNSPQEISMIAQMGRSNVTTVATRWLSCSLGSKLSLCETTCSEAMMMSSCVPSPHQGSALQQSAFDF